MTQTLSAPSPAEFLGMAFKAVSSLMVSTPGWKCLRRKSERGMLRGVAGAILPERRDLAAITCERSALLAWCAST